MRKFKLIKEYPGSPKLNTILTHEELQYCNWNEYYEEVVEKDYEILSLKCKSHDRLYILHSNGLYAFENEKGYSKLDISLNSGWFINSIKRLSDGEIFTIGDIVNTKVDDKYKQSILEINVKDNTVIFKTKLGFVILYIAKKTKQPLFTTEDGVDIFNGVRFWNVNIFYNLDEFQVTNDKYPLKFIKDGSKQFSTKEKAEEYILMNKPCLSINDVINTSCTKAEFHYLRTISVSKNKLKKLVKEKLKTIK